MLRKTEWVDMPTFQTETELDDETVVELYGVFLEELRDERARLKAALDVSDWTAGRKLVHNIKGISASYRAGRVLLGATMTDLLFKGGNNEAAGEKIPSVLEDMDSTIQSLEGLLERGGLDG